MGSRKNMQVMWMIKALLACYLVTGLLLVLIAFVFYKWNLTEPVVTAFIVSTYAISTFVGGLIAGKLKDEKKKLWGFLIGMIYFILLLMVSFGVYREVESSSRQILTTLFLCVGGAVLGSCCCNQRKKRVK